MNETRAGEAFANGTRVNQALDLEDARPPDADEPARTQPVRTQPVQARRTGRRAMWFGVAGLTAVATIAAVGLPQLGWLFEQSATTTWTANHPIDAVDVQLTGGDLTILPSRGADAISLRQTLTWTVNKPQVDESWQGDRLVITESCAGPSIAIANPCGASLELAVPAGVSVQSSVESGSLAVRGMTGNLTVRAQSGDIELDRDSGTLWARAASGSVVGTGLTAAQVNAQTLSGDVDLSFAAAPDVLSASAASGDVIVAVPRGATYRVSGQSASGNRQIDASLEDSSASRQITLDSASGDVTLGYTGAS